MKAKIFDIINWFKTIIYIVFSSVTSVRFYQRVILHYHGYGIKYALTLSFIAALFCNLLILNHTSNLKQYLTQGIITKDVNKFDYIISQLPVFYYDGNNLSIEGNEPLYINDANNQPVIAIDPENKIPAAVRAKIFLLFTNKNFVISFFQNNNDSRNIVIKYSQILGNDSQVLTHESQKILLLDLLDKVTNVIIYFLFPLLGGIIFFNLLIEKSLFILLLYAFSNFASIVFSMKTCIRVTFFSASMFILIQPLMLFTIPEYIKFAWGIQIWANFLMLLAIIKIYYKKTS